MSRSNMGQLKLTFNGLSPRFKRMLEVYEIFAADWRRCQRFTEDAAIELFNHESYGTPLEPDNGYALGKKWLNVTVTMWRDDVRDGNLFKYELYAPHPGEISFPHWWLDSVLENMYVNAPAMRVSC